MFVPCKSFQPSLIIQIQVRNIHVECSIRVHSKLLSQILDLGEELADSNAKVFVPYKSFQPSLIFGSRVRNIPIREHSKLLSQILDLGEKDLTGTKLVCLQLR